MVSKYRIVGKPKDYYVQFLNKNRRWENLYTKLPIGLYVIITYRTKDEAINRFISLRNKKYKRIKHKRYNGSIM